MSRVLSDAMRTEISGYFTQNVPPKPQQISGSAISTTWAPTASSSLRGCCLMPSSRRPEQLS